MRFVGALVVAFVCFSSPATMAGERNSVGDEAQAPKDQDTTKYRKKVFKDQVGVTAARQEQESSKTPAAVSVITAENIKRRQPEKMADLFKELPSVDVQGEGPSRIPGCSRRVPRVASECQLEPMVFSEQALKPNVTPETGLSENPESAEELLPRRLQEHNDRHRGNDVLWPAASGAQTLPGSDGRKRSLVLPSRS